MDQRTARELARMTGAFYAAVSASFSATRAHPWEGWQRVAELAGIGTQAPGEQRPPEPAEAGIGEPREREHTHGAQAAETQASEAQASHGAAGGLEPVQGEAPDVRDRLRALDLACGNLRFERFLEAALAEAHDPRRLVAYAVDSCDALADPRTVQAELHYQHLDLAELLLCPPLDTPLAPEPVELAVCFGFMHHLPLPEQRVGLLDALVDACAPGGVVAVSFWQLSHSPKLLAKAERTTAVARAAHGLDGLSPRDYLLGWQERDDVLRFAHDFSEAEVDELAAAVADRAAELARFSADGATGDLNRYLVLRRRASSGGVGSA